ncbi:hypothetical protein B0H17DRAFT_1213748 [Mycena rosella]|uniref:Uncharacterized protein n=1 Tax=Mycena rosella TaxID=1033263 RepID=A0AAD7G564_MYCRO|nr:hypothetical protein B0H17DRAFT_1213748 [Mycena rosella]
MLFDPSTASEVRVIIRQVQVAWAIAAGETLLYGAYLVMFGFYIHVLRKRQNRKQRFLTATTISLFLLSTAHCALVLAITVVEGKVPSAETEGANIRNQRVTTSLVSTASAVYVTSNVVADTIFIFRCYAICNRQWKIIIVPTILTLGVASVGYATSVQDVLSLVGLAADSAVPGLSFLSIAVSLVTNFVLMVLTVSRIWGLAREARKSVGRHVADRYYTVCAMIVESGALYLVGGIVFLVLFVEEPLEDLFYNIQTGAILAQLVAIAPTIIAVRVGLGYSVENVDSFIAPRPRTRPLPQFTRAIPKAESMEPVLYIHADNVEPEV